MQDRKISKVEYWEIIEAPEYTKISVYGASVVYFAFFISNTSAIGAEPLRYPAGTVMQSPLSTSLKATVSPFSTMQISEIFSSVYGTKISASTDSCTVGYSRNTYTESPFCVNERFQLWYGAQMRVP